MSEIIYQMTCTSCGGNSFTIYNKVEKTHASWNAECDSDNPDCKPILLSTHSTLEEINN